MSRDAIAELLAFVAAGFAIVFLGGLALILFAAGVLP